MATAISIVALLVSLASLAFGVYQYRVLHGIRTDEKAASLLRMAHDLRRKSHDLKYMIDVTDHVADCPKFLAGIESLVEDQITKLVNSDKRSLGLLFEFEQGMLSLDTELDLLQKQVEAARRFYEEEQQYLAKRAGE